MRRPSFRVFFNPRRLFCRPSPELLKTGDTLKQSKIFTSSDIDEYSKLSGDFNLLHFDLECAKNAGFHDIPVPGMLVATLFPRIIASHFPGAVYAKQTLEFKSPVFVDECIVGAVQASGIRRARNDRFLAKFDTECVKDGSGIVVISGEAIAILPSLALK
ncbi:hypothetical protein M569_02608 [Genlisea aurea]|uniref:MaoC-like domain-containing protein n=1 Tax=Genlisea aurea TaxID=192259 RepID=S8E8G9_9LAMI|nr:hypothetical protein M569_02608 [Genlisea aurea]